MNRIYALALATLLCMGMFAGCASQSPVSAPDTPAPAADTPAPVADTPAPAADTPAPVADAPAPAGPNKVINLWSFTDEVPKMVNRYKELHPDFAYDFNTTIIATTEGAYQPALDQALSGGGGTQVPDMYCAESAFVLKYSQGDASDYAAAYKELGIDADNLLSAAQIAPYASDIGTRPSDGQLVALPYQATGGAFIYRRSLAKDTWGTDDPTAVKDKIGPGWNKFMQAAAELKAKGYAIVSGDGDVWHPLENNSEKGWIVDGKLYIDPGREMFLDIAKQLKDNAYMNDTVDWQDPWFADMKDAGPQKVFGYFGPAWLINYVMAGNCGDTSGDWAVCEPPTGFSWGGTWVFANVNGNPEVRDAVAEIIQWITLDTSEEGLQYFWANGTLNGPGGTKDTVASGVVMSKSDGTLDFLGGQNMFDVFVPAGETATGKNKTQYDETINIYFRDQVRMYTSGEKTRDQAIADFKQMVADNLDVIVE